MGSIKVQRYSRQWAALRDAGYVESRTASGAFVYMYMPAIR